MSKVCQFYFRQHVRNKMPPRQELGRPTKVQKAGAAVASKVKKTRAAATTKVRTRGTPALTKGNSKQATSSTKITTRGTPETESETETPKMLSGLVPKPTRKQQRQPAASRGKIFNEVHKQKYGVHPCTTKLSESLKIKIVTSVVCSFCVAFGREAKIAPAPNTLSTFITSMAWKDTCSQSSTRSLRTLSRPRSVCGLALLLMLVIECHTDIPINLFCLEICMCF